MAIPNRSTCSAKSSTSSTSRRTTIYLTLQIVDNRVASTTLATQIAANNAPDIVGPVGTVGRATFDGNWLDLTAEIQANNFDMSVYEPSVVQNYNLPGQGQIGIPFAVYPSFIYFNKDLFDEAGLAVPAAAFWRALPGQGVELRHAARASRRN